MCMQACVHTCVRLCVHVCVRQTLNSISFSGSANGHVQEEWAHFADLVLGWALDPSTVTGPEINAPGLFRGLSGEGEPPTPGAPVYSASSDAAWENLTNSDYHR